jgi:hypothetical protein
MHRLGRHPRALRPAAARDGLGRGGDQSCSRPRSGRGTGARARGARQRRRRPAPGRLPAVLGSTRRPARPARACRRSGGVRARARPDERRRRPALSRRARRQGALGVGDRPAKPSPRTHALTHASVALRCTARAACGPREDPAGRADAPASGRRVTMTVLVTGATGTNGLEVVKQTPSVTARSTTRRAPAPPVTSMRGTPRRSRPRR